MRPRSSSSTTWASPATRWPVSSRFLHRAQCDRLGEGDQRRRLALHGDGRHLVSLDQAIATMRQTGRDMSHKSKETSLGGLALNVVECGRHAVARSSCKKLTFIQQ
jgi:hypothetical protein